MYDQIQTAQNAINSPVSRPLTRIENDIEQIKGLTVRLESMSERITSHARSLGYFGPPAEGAKGAAPTPVTITMSDAIKALGHAVDNCSGSLALFD